MYRPQFAYPTPDGFTDQDCDQYFDGNNAPLLNLSGGPDLVSNIPLQLDKDADFLWRGIKIPNLRGIVLNLGIQLRGPDGRYLSPSSQLIFPPGNTTVFIPVWLWAWQSSQYDGLTGGPGCIIEPEIYCQKGSVIMLDYQNLTRGGGSIDFAVVLTGVKRWPKSLCCGETCHV